jgi:uncharacterized protein YeaO (DUF488 family)/iron-sulfur cluster repair protein YtfE (RIC family)
MTMTATQACEAMRAHHRVLGERLAARAGAVSGAVASGVPYQAAVGRFIAYLAGEVLPHAAAEEKTLYPFAAANTGLAGLIGEMTAEHVTLSAAGSRLAVLTDGSAAAGQARQIAELFATHTAKENEVLLPVLLGGGAPDLTAVLGRMHCDADAAGPDTAGPDAALDTVGPDIVGPDTVGPGTAESGTVGSDAGADSGPPDSAAWIRVGRVYDPPSPRDGFRVLVDRVWPRGLRKDDPRYDDWAKDVAPSAQLRVWYRHEPARFDEFRRRYLAELATEPVKLEAVSRLRAKVAEGPVTLVTATKELNLSQAAVLAEFLARR